MWAIIEMMGHNVLAGEVTPSLDFPGLIQINVPASDENRGFTKIVNQSAVYAITPVTEETARVKAYSLQSTPFQDYDVRQVILDKIRNAAPELSQGLLEEEEDGSIYESGAFGEWKD